MSCHWDFPWCCWDSQQGGQSSLEPYMVQDGGKRRSGKKAGVTCKRLHVKDGWTLQKVMLKTSTPISLLNIHSFHLPLSSGISRILSSVHSIPISLYLLPLKEQHQNTVSDLKCCLLLSSSETCRSQIMFLHVTWSCETEKYHWLTPEERQKKPPEQSDYSCLWSKTKGSSLGLLNVLSIWYSYFLLGLSHLLDSFWVLLSLCAICPSFFFFYCPPCKPPTKFCPFPHYILALSFTKWLWHSKLHLYKNLLQHLTFWGQDQICLWAWKR